jgi:hypothetical protein
MHGFRDRYREPGCEGRRRTEVRINIEVGFRGVGWMAGLLKEE